MVLERSIATIIPDSPAVLKKPLLEQIEILSQMPQTPMPVKHRFQDGVYIREIFMPADTYVIGHVHRCRHFNMVLEGKAWVHMENHGRVVKAGEVIESGPLVQKALYIIEDCRWATIHANPTNSRDIEFLENEIVHLSPDLAAARKGMTLDEFRMNLPKFLKP